jgi:hypothetical protein
LVKDFLICISLSFFVGQTPCNLYTYISSPPRSGSTGLIVAKGTIRPWGRASIQLGSTPLRTIYSPKPGTTPHQYPRSDPGGQEGLGGSWRGSNIGVCLVPEKRTTVRVTPIDSLNWSGLGGYTHLVRPHVPAGGKRMAQQRMNFPSPMRPTLSEGQARAGDTAIARDSEAWPRCQDSRLKGSPGRASAIVTVPALTQDQQTSRAKTRSQLWNLAPRAWQAKRHYTAFRSIAMRHCQPLPRQAHARRGVTHQDMRLP